MSSGPPPYPPGPQGPYPGQQPWPAYPGYGPPPPPPPKKGNAALWVVLGLVVVLVAGGLTYFLAFHESEPDAGPGGGSGGGGSSDSDVAEVVCEGDYCVGNYPYANACGVFPPAEVAARIGEVGGEGLQVQESYADPLPPSGGEKPPTWVYGVRSRCDISPVDSQAAAFRTVTVELQQNGRGPAQEPTRGKPLAGFDGALVEELDGRASITWARGNTAVTFDVTWTNRKPAIPQATLVEAAKALDAALADPPGPPVDIPDHQVAGRTIVADACRVYTGADFQAATGFLVDPINVRRGYTTGGLLQTSCMRTTASRNTGIPEAPGTTLLDGSMAPALRIVALRDDAEAKSWHTDERERLARPQELPGVAPDAVFGIKGNRFSVVFTSGTQLVTIDCGLSNGNADWTPDDMRQRLEPLAKAIAAKLP